MLLGLLKHLITDSNLKEIPVWPNLMRQMALTLL